MKLIKKKKVEIFFVERRLYIPVITCEMTEYFCFFIFKLIAFHHESAPCGSRRQKQILFKIWEKQTTTQCFYTLLVYMSFFDEGKLK